MATEELKPRSAVLREALEKAKQGDKPLPMLLSVPETLKQLGGISRWKLDRMRRENEIESVKIGRRRFFPLKAIEQYIEELRKKEGG